VTALGRWLPAAALLAPLVLLAPARLQAQPAAASTAGVPRPRDAPLLGKPVELAALPAEYLQHDEAGVRFAYHPSARDRVRPLIEMAEHVRAALRRDLGQPVLATAEVRVAMSAADLGRITPFASGAPGTSFSELKLLVIDLSSSPGSEPPDAREVFRHGMAHLALDELSAGRALPRWLHEGFAASFSDRPDLSSSLALGWAAFSGRLVPLGSMDAALRDADADDPLAAAQAEDFVRYLLDDARGAAFPDLVARLARGEDSQSALRGAYGPNEQKIETSWRKDLARRTVFAPLLVVGLALSLLLFGGIQWHRRRRPKPAPAESAMTLPDAALPRPLRSHAPELRVRVIQVQRAEHDADADDEELLRELALGEPHSEDVPKVSHNGRWHTLH
jgi:hypothetical protein